MHFQIYRLLPAKLVWHFSGLKGVRTIQHVLIDKKAIA